MMKRGCASVRPGAAVGGAPFDLEFVAKPFAGFGPHFRPCMVSGILVLSLQT